MKIITTPKIFLLTCVPLLAIMNSNAISQETLKKPVPQVDELYLSTTFIERFTGETKLGSATGFFFQTADSTRLFLITNRHVVRDEKNLMFPDKLRLHLHIDRSDLRRSVSYDVALYGETEKKQRRWIEINESIDVIAIEFALQDLEKYNIKPLNPSRFAPQGTLFAVGEPLVILGYPLGFFDEVHNLPIARQGAIASAFPIPFKGEPYFLVDANLHQGTSGSPVFSRPARVSMTDAGQRVFGPRVYLLGINSGFYGGLNLNIVWFTKVIDQLTR